MKVYVVVVSRRMHPYGSPDWEEVAGVGLTPEEAEAIGKAAIGKAALSTRPDSEAIYDFDFEEHVIGEVFGMPGPPSSSEPVTGRELERWQSMRETIRVQRNAIDDLRTALRDVVEAMQLWGSWGDGIPEAGDDAHGSVGATYDRAVFLLDEGHPEAVDVVGAPYSSPEVGDLRDQHKTALAELAAAREVVKAARARAGWCDCDWEITGHTGACLKLAQALRTYDGLTEAGND